MPPAIARPGPSRARRVGDLKAADLKGKRVFVRADLNVPLDKSMKITDDTRIRAAVPTVKVRRSPRATRVHRSQPSSPTANPPPTRARGPLALRNCSCTHSDTARSISHSHAPPAPSPQYLMDNGAKVLLTSHLGRPKGGPEDKYRLGPVRDRLQELLGKPVEYAKDCIGAEVPEMVSKMGEGSVLLLENVRFYKASSCRGGWGGMR